MKNLFIFIIVHFALNVHSQCLLDSVVFKYYTLLDIHDNTSYKSIDSTLLFDRPNSNWVDIYENEKIVKRIVRNTPWKENVTTFNYSDDRIVKISKHTRGFENTMDFFYNGQNLVRIVKSSPYFKSTEYSVDNIDRGYKLNFIHNESKRESWYTIDTILLNKCGGIKYGKIDMLDFTLGLEWTSTDISRGIDIESWPDRQDYYVECRKDGCGNTEVYSEIVKETGYVFKLYQMTYYYRN